MWICGVQRRIAEHAVNPAKTANNVSKATAFVAQDKSIAGRRVWISAAMGPIVVDVVGLVRAVSFAQMADVPRRVRAKHHSHVEEAVWIRKATPRTVDNATLRVRQGSYAKRGNAFAPKDGQLAAINVPICKAIQPIVEHVAGRVRVDNAAQADNALRIARKVRRPCAWAVVSTPRPTPNIADNAVSVALHNNNAATDDAFVLLACCCATVVASIRAAINRIVEPAETSVTTEPFAARANVCPNVPLRQRRSVWGDASIRKQILHIVENAPTLVR